MGIKEILALIPEQYHLLVAALALLVYYGLPRFQEWRGHKRYFDAQTKVLEYRKLLYEAESIRKQHDLGEVADAGLRNLMALADEMRPVTEVLPAGKRFLAGCVGSLIAFAILGVFYLSGPGKGSSLLAFSFGALLLSLVAGLSCLLYRANKHYKSALFGAGAGWIISFVIGTLTG